MTISRLDHLLLLFFSSAIQDWLLSHGCSQFFQWGFHVCNKSVRFSRCLGRAPLEAHPAWQIRLTDKPCTETGLVWPTVFSREGSKIITPSLVLCSHQLWTLCRGSAGLSQLPFCADLTEPLRAGVDSSAAQQPLPAPCFRGFAVQCLCSVRGGSQHRGTAPQPCQHWDGVLWWVCWGSEPSPAKGHANRHRGGKLPLNF